MNAIKSTSSAFIFIQLKEIFDRKALRPFEVSSRGSVGSSLAAYLCGFSEIDPIKAKLSPYFFYGYKGDREPDIDLNFRSGIQREIHKAFERVSGVETVIKAGTLGTISEKDADKLIDDYSEKHHKYFWTYRNEIKSCLTKTVKAKGQHPGGLILLPWGTEASDICPTKSIGYPPIRDEATSPIVSFGNSFTSSRKISQSSISSGLALMILSFNSKDASSKSISYTPYIINGAIGPSLLILIKYPSD